MVNDAFQVRESFVFSFVSSSRGRKAVSLGNRDTLPVTQCEGDPPTSSHVPRFRGNLFYVVQRYRTTAIANGDCHKDLHRSVQIAYFAQRKSLYRVVVVLYGVSVYFMTCPTVNRHSPDARHNVLLILSTDIWWGWHGAFRHPR